MEIEKVHLLFEQSGTFKNAFAEKKIVAYDYDINNYYNHTDYIIDLFAEIEKCYMQKSSIFDNFSKKDLIIAFFPCIYFCNFNQMYFTGASINYRGKTKIEIIDEIINRNKQRSYYYEILLKLFSCCINKNFRLIVENPYSPNHFLYNNFPFKPSLIDFNRNKRGDFFLKPTQYFFLNCEVENKYSSKSKAILKKIKSLTGHHGSFCDRERSEISIEYARNFINDFILSEVSAKTEKNLFNYKDF